MNKLSRLTALLLAVMLLLGSIASAEGLPIGGLSGLTSDDWDQLVDAAEANLFYTDEGDTGSEVTPESPEQPQLPASYPYTDVDEITLVQSQASAEAFMTASGAVKITHEAAGQWQMKVGEVWANLLGETGAVLTVNSAMLSGQKKGEVRKGLGEKNVETGAYAAYTQTAVIYVIESVPAMYSISRDAESDGAVSDANDGIMSLELANQENMVIIEVAYRISGTDQPVADSYIGQIAKYSALKTTLTLPRVLGYKAAAVRVEPQQLADVASFTPPGEDQAGTVTLNVTEEQSIKNISICVEYEPTQVNYTVRHMHQDKVGDGYTLDVEEVLTGMTGKSVGANLQKTYEGFSYIWYDPETSIAADGSTVVEIRYNREYYLMTFDLGGGYGVEPIFARFGAEIEVDEKEIKRPGYDFVGWTDEAGNAAEIPATMPLGGGKYKAVWTETNTTYTVVYWRADVDDGNASTPVTYSYWGYDTVNSQSGTVLKPSVVGGLYPAADADMIAAGNEAGYFTYDADATTAQNIDEKTGVEKTVIVAGDGTSVVNVYYSRNEYTIWFVYTRKSGNDYYFASSTGCGTYNNKNHSNSYHEMTINGKKPDKKSISWSYHSSVKPVVAEGLTTGTFTEADGTTNYEYHYISLTAEYGANLETVWPAAPLAKVGNKYDFGSWAVQCGSNYRIKYGNEHSNIVGAYPVMSSDLIMDPANKHAQTMVAWWGDSGAKVGEHTYHIYFEALPGEVADEEYTDRDKVTRQYVRQPDSVFTCAHNTTTRVDPFAYEGYTCVNDTRGTKNDYQANASNYLKGGARYDCPDDSCAACQTFYYKRNDYTLSFYNYNDASQAEAPESKQLLFGEAFSAYNPGAPKEPANVEAGSLRFVGWYTTPEAFEHTEVDWESGTMPASDLTFYAKWELVEHDVRFWLDKMAADTADETKFVVDYPAVTHGMTIPDIYNKETDYISPDKWLVENPQHAYSKYDFAGWYYMDDGVEKRFDIGSMPIKSDMDIYAKWTSNDPVKFVFKFYHENGMQLAEDYEGVALPNTPVTMSAKIGDALTMTPAGKDPLEYIPLVSSHTLVLDVDAEKNVYTFVYKEPDTINYIVQYLEAKSVTDENGREVLVPNLDKNGNLIHKATEKHVSTTKAVVTENYVPVSGYMPQETQLRLIVSMDETANVIQFLYLPNQVDAPYNVSHYIIDHDKRKSLYASEMNKLGRIDQTISVDKLNEQSIPGYTFDKAEVAVPTQVDGEWQDVLYDPDQVTESQVQHRLPNAGMHVYLYYKPIDYPVVVRYLDAVTGEPLVDANGAQIESITYMLPYGDTVKTQDYYQEIPDYRYVRMDPLEKKVEIEPNVENPTVNILNIYYTLDVADITISKTIAVSTDPDAPEPTQEQMETAFIFHVTLTHATKEQRDSYITIDGVRQPQAVKNGVLTFQLKKDQSATIHDLWGGTAYEVREEDHKDFKTSYDSFYQGELSSLDVNTVVTNTFPKYVGELTIVKQGLAADKESAIVQVKIGGDTYYLALNASNKYTAVITGIKPETDYSVEEVTAWTWQYSSGVSGGSTGNGTGRITNEHPTATVYITNRYEGDKWLHDESHVINNFDTGKSNGVNN